MMKPYLFSFILIVALLGSAQAAMPESPDDRLRELLRDAIADTDSFADRFEAEVWLVDMSARLKKTMPNDEHRLAFLKMVHYEAGRAELEPELVLAVIQVESYFDRWAISVAGAQGMMQIMPFWLDEIGRPGDNLFHIQTNLRMGCTILKHYLDIERGDLTRALGRYNGSLGKFKYPNKVYQALRSRWYRQ